jgi:hypothetical protein
MTGVIICNILSGHLSFQTRNTIPMVRGDLKTINKRIPFSVEEKLYKNIALKVLL